MIEYEPAGADGKVVVGAAMGTLDNIASWLDGGIDDWGESMGDKIDAALANMAGRLVCEDPFRTLLRGVLIGASAFGGMDEMEDDEQAAMFRMLVMGLFKQWNVERQGGENRMPLS